MKLLCVDTSSPHFSLAISENREVLNYRNFSSQRFLSSSIIPSIRFILKKADLTLSQLDGFAIGLGPGSFTSLRVGLSTIKAFAFALNKPVVGVSSLDIIAMNTLEKNENICVICDARRDLIFACIYKRKKTSVLPTTAYMLIPLNKLWPMLLDLDNMIFIGDGIQKYKKEIQNYYKRHNKKKLFSYSFAEEKKWYPQSKCLVPLAVERFQNKDIDDIDQLLPHYLYPDDCQVRRKAASK